jgi:sodium-dependent dicarboxylate transporter 2/3/5
VAAVFALVAALWISRPLLSGWIPALSDAGIAVAGGLALFLVPAGGGEGEPLLRWRDAARLPWGVLILFGGGLSLASAIQDTGLTRWIGEATEGLAGYPLVLVIAVPVAVVVLLTELTSNTATAAAFLPILASMAVGAGQDPRALAVPAALAASCAFMLPVATPPNAIVYGSGAVTVPEMARAGVWLNLLFVALVTAAAMAWLPVVFGVEFGVVPGWAG